MRFPGLVLQIPPLSMKIQLVPPNSTYLCRYFEANLMSPCTRFLLVEKMDDGLLRLPWAAPDFGRVRAVGLYTLNAVYP
jgi:hypothetical protein